MFSGPFGQHDEVRVRDSPNREERFQDSTSRPPFRRVRPNVHSFPSLPSTSVPYKTSVVNRVNRLLSEEYNRPFSLILIILTSNASSITRSTFDWLGHE